jgi:hypothetical protein
VIVRVGVASALGGLVLGLAAAAVGVPNAAVTVAVVVRAVFVLLLLAVAVPGLLNGLDPAVDTGRLQPSVLVGATTGYLLDPLSWGGRAFVAQLLFEPGAVTFAVDAALWVAITWAAATLRVRSSRQRRDTPGSYLA